MSVHVFPGKQGCQVNWGELRVKKELSAAELDYLGSLIPTTVDARARNGSVTLTGTADWQYRRDEAEFLTASVPGCPQSRTNIRLTSTQNASEHLGESLGTQISGSR